MGMLLRAVARNTLIQVIGRAFSIILALVVVAIMTRALGPDGFGGYSTIIAFLQFFGITVDFGLTLTASRMLAATTTKEQADKLMSNLLTMRFCSALILLSTAPLIALLFPYSIEVKYGLALTTLSFLAILLGQTLGPVFRQALQTQYVVLAELAGRLALLSGVALAAWKHAGLLPFMAAVVMGSLVQYVCTHIFAKKFIRVRLAFDWDLWRAILRTSWPIGIAILFNLVYLKADTIILSILRPQAEVGFYGAAYRVIDQFTALATMFVSLILPPLTTAWIAGNRKRFQQIYQGSFDTYAVIAFPLMVSALLLGRPLMQLVAGSAYEPSGAVLGVLMIAMTGVFFSTLFGHLVVVLEKQKAMLWGYAVTAALAIPAYLYWIPRYGMWGAAWSTVGAEVLIMALTAIMVWRTTRLALQLTVLGKSLLASLLMGAFLYFMRDTNLAILLIGSVLVYGAALYAFGGIKKETLREIFLLKST